MATTVGPYAQGVEVRVRAAFTDSRGTHCPAGLRARLRHLQLDWKTFGLELQLRPDDAAQPPLALYFDAATLRSFGAAGLDHHFELTDETRVEVDTPIAAARADARPRERTGQGKGLKDRLRRWFGASGKAMAPAAGAPLDEHLRHALQLLHQRGADTASPYWRGIASATVARDTGNPDACRDIAEWLEAAAQRCIDRDGFIEDREAWTWLREECLHGWYCWGAQATSGGEGTERSRWIRAAEARFEDCERTSQR